MMLNHILLGCRVSYKGKPCIVTGAKCTEAGEKIKFRLLDQKEHREFWTGVRPCFESIRQPIYKPYRQFVLEKRASGVDKAKEVFHG